MDFVLVIGFGPSCCKLVMVGPTPQYIHAAAAVGCSWVRLMNIRAQMNSLLSIGTFFCLLFM